MVLGLVVLLASLVLLDCKTSLSSFRAFAFFAVKRKHFGPPLDHALADESDDCEQPELATFEKL